MTNSCPFCRISTTYPAIPPSSTSLAQVSSLPDPSDPSHAHLVLSTKHVLAFLDIMPLTQGHLLVVPRDHYEKIADMGVKAGRELGQWLPILSRVVMRTLFGENAVSLSDPSWNWNVVQNNGVGAAQQVPHVHFHIIPRPPLGAAPSGTKTGFVMFGRGNRDDLDDGEGETLARELREELAREVQRVKKEEGVDLEVEYDDPVEKRRLMGKI